MASRNCVFCKKTFDSEESLKIHFRQHGDPTQHYFINNTRKKHSTKGQPPSEIMGDEKDLITCDVCPEVFATISKAIAHKHKMHREFAANYFCPWCGKLFTMKHLYDKHLTSHETCIASDEIFPCDLCSVSFYEVSAMNYHNKFYHRLEIPACGHSKKHKIIKKELVQLFYCPLCGQEYVNKVNLHNHMNVDHGYEDNSMEEVLRCSVCDAIFYHEKAYIHHLTFHSKDDVYCDSDNSNKNDLTEFTIETVPPIKEQVEEDVGAGSRQAEDAISSIGVNQFLELAMGVSPENDNENADQDSPSTSEQHKHKKHKKHKKSKRSAITLDEFLNMNTDVFGEDLDFHGVEEVPTQVVAKQFKKVSQNTPTVLKSKAMSAANLQKLRQQGIVVKVKTANKIPILPGTTSSHSIPIGKPVKFASAALDTKKTKTNLKFEDSTSNSTLSKLMTQTNNQLKIVKKPSQENARTNKSNSNNAELNIKTVPSSLEQSYEGCVQLKSEDNCETIVLQSPRLFNVDTMPESLKTILDVNDSEEISASDRKTFNIPESPVKQMAVKNMLSPSTIKTNNVSKKKSLEEEDVSDSKNKLLCNTQLTVKSISLTTNSDSSLKPLKTKAEETFDDEEKSGDSDYVGDNSPSEKCDLKQVIPEEMGTNCSTNNLLCNSESESKSEVSTKISTDNKSANLTDVTEKSIVTVSEELSGGEAQNNFDRKQDEKIIKVESFSQKLWNNSQLTIKSLNSTKLKTKDNIQSLMEVKKIMNEDQILCKDLEVPVHDDEEENGGKNNPNNLLKTCTENICSISTNKVLNNSELSPKPNMKNQLETLKSKSFNKPIVMENEDDITTIIDDSDDEDMENQIATSVLKKNVHIQSNFVHSQNAVSNSIKDLQNKSSLKINSLNILKNIKGITVKSSNQSIAHSQSGISSKNVDVLQTVTDVKTKPINNKSPTELQTDIHEDLKNDDHNISNIVKNVTGISGKSNNSQSHKILQTAVTEGNVSYASTVFKNRKNITVKSVNNTSLKESHTEISEVNLKRHIPIGSPFLKNLKDPTVKPIDVQLQNMSHTAISDEDLEDSDLNVLKNIKGITVKSRNNKPVKESDLSVENHLPLRSIVLRDVTVRSDNRFATDLQTDTSDEDLEDSCHNVNILKNMKGITVKSNNDKSLKEVHTRISDDEIEHCDTNVSRTLKNIKSITASRNNNQFSNKLQADISDEEIESSIQNVSNILKNIKGITVKSNRQSLQKLQAQASDEDLEDSHNVDNVLKNITGSIVKSNNNLLDELQTETYDEDVKEGLQSVSNVLKNIKDITVKSNNNKLHTKVSRNNVDERTPDLTSAVKMNLGDCVPNVSNVLKNIEGLTVKSSTMKPLQKLHSEIYDEHSQSFQGVRNTLKNIKGITVKSNNQPTKSDVDLEHIENSDDDSFDEDDDNSEGVHGHNDGLQNFNIVKDANKDIQRKIHDNNAKSEESDFDENSDEFPDEVINDQEIIVNKLKNTNVGLSIRTIKNNVNTTSSQNSKTVNQMKEKHIMPVSTSIALKRNVNDAFSNSKDLSIKSSKQMKTNHQAMTEKCVQQVRNVNTDATKSRIKSINKEHSLVNKAQTVSQEVTVKTVQTETVIEEITTTVTKTIRTVNQTVNESVSMASKTQSSNNKIINSALNTKMTQMKRPAPPFVTANQGIHIRPTARVPTNIVQRQARPNQNLTKVPQLNNPIRPSTSPQLKSLVQGTAIVRRPTPSPNQSGRVVGKPLRIAANIMNHPTAIKRPISDKPGPFSCFKKPKESLIPVADLSEADLTQTIGAGCVNKSIQMIKSNFSCRSQIVKSSSMMTSDVSSSTNIDSSVSQQLSKLSKTSGLKIVQNSAKSAQNVMEKSTGSSSNLTLLEKLKQQGLLVKKPSLDLGFSDDSDSNEGSADDADSKCLTVQSGG